MTAAAKPSPVPDTYRRVTIDPFGHGWTIATHVEDVSPEELTRRMAALSGEAGGSER